MLNRGRVPYEFSMFLEFDRSEPGGSLSFDLWSWTNDRTWQTCVARGWAWLPVRFVERSSTEAGVHPLGDAREIIDFDVLVDPWNLESLSLRPVDDWSNITSTRGICSAVGRLGWLQRRRYRKALCYAATKALGLSGNVDRFLQTFGQDVRWQLAWMEARTGLHDDEQLRHLRLLVEGLPDPTRPTVFGNVIDARGIFPGRLK